MAQCVGLGAGRRGDVRREGGGGGGAVAWEGARRRSDVKWAQSIKRMDCNMFFNAKSVALADDANLKNFWLIGFEL